MKKTALIAATAMTLMLMTAARPANDVITKDGKTTVVNTTTLTKKVRGFHGPTPNQESPKYFALAKKVLDKYTGKSVKKAATMKVDATTGATFSTKALIKNVQEGVKYYNNNK